MKWANYTLSSFFIFLAILISFVITQDKIPVFVYTHFRHGAREPTSVDEQGYDSFGNKWKNPGELTPSGMRQHYVLGYRNYIKYKNFLSEQFDPSELYVMSSVVNRTIQSGMSHLLGLFPPSTGPTLKTDQQERAIPPLKHFPNELENIISNLNNTNYSLPNKINQIPIHQISNSEQNFLIHYDYKCPVVGKIKKENEKWKPITEMTKMFNTKYGDALLNYFKIKDNPNKYNKFKEISNLCDQYIAGMFNGYNFTNFTGAIGTKPIDFLNKCQEVSGIEHEFLIFGDTNKDVAVMTMSDQMNRWVDFMARRVKQDISGKGRQIGDFSTPKMVILSAHDSTISATELLINKLFDISKYVNPVYASFIFFEVYKKDLKNYAKDFSDYYVEYSINEEVINTWDFDYFHNTLKSKLWSHDKVSKFCDHDIIVNRYEKKMYMLLIITHGVFIWCLLTALVVALIMLRKKNMIEQYELNNFTVIK